MKIEDPLYRKVSIYLLQFKSPIEAWMTDTEINFMKNHNLEMIDFIRIKSGNGVTFEIDSNSILRFEYSDEIRHKRSPVLLRSGTKMIENESMLNPLVEKLAIDSNEKEMSFIYFAIGSNLYHSEVTYVPEFENIKRSSLSLFNLFFEKYLLIKFKVPSVRVLMSTYYL